MRRSLITLVAVTVALVGSAPAFASGFSIFEQSAKASGQAGAWVARADDAAANWYNPAALVRLEGGQVQFGTNFIDIGAETSFTINDPEAQFVSGVPAGTTFDAESNVVFPSHFYWSQTITDRVAIGIGFNNPFGLVTEWADAPLTFVSKKAELTTFVLNPNLAWKVGEYGAFAIGIDYIYADIGEFSRLVPVPELETIGSVNLTGTGGDLGWNLATHYQRPNWSFGLTYRSGLNPGIEGNVDWSGMPTPGDMELLNGESPLFPDTRATSKLFLPEQAAIGFAYTGAEKVDIEFDISWAAWSSFRSLNVDLQNEPLIGDGDIVIDENWTDTFAFRLGLAWALNDANELRFGFVHDQNPIPFDRVRPTIPDADRDGVTLGYGYRGERWDFDVYGMRIQFDDREAEGSFFSQGVIDGTYENSINLFGVTVGRRY